MVDQVTGLMEIKIKNIQNVVIFRCRLIKGPYPQEMANANFFVLKARELKNKYVG